MNVKNIKCSERNECWFSFEFSYHIISNYIRTITKLVITVYRVSNLLSIDKLQLLKKLPLYRVPFHTNW